MGTETRIGVATGLLLVALSSVYFFWSSGGEEEDLLVGGNAKPVAALKGNASAAQAEKPAAADRRTASAQRPRTAEARRPTANSNTTAGQGSPRIPPSRTQPAGPAAPPAAVVARQPSGASGSIANPAARTPAGAAAGGETAVAQGPMGPSAAPSTPLRSEASPGLVEATRENLARDASAGSKDTAANPAMKPDPSDLAAVGENIRRMARANSDAASGTGTNTALQQGEARPTAMAARNTPVSAANANPRPSPVSSGTDSPTNRVAQAGSGPAPRIQPIGSSTSAGKLAPASDDSWPRRHVIEQGDTLSDISLTYYESTRHVDLILKANPHIKGPRSLKIGDSLAIPRLDVSDRAANIIARIDAARTAEKARIKPVTQRTTAPQPTSPAAAGGTTNPPAIGRSDAAGRTASPNSVRPAGAARAAAASYTVREGDTFYSIARKTLGDERRWKELFQKNRTMVKGDPKRLRAGMVLMLPG